MSDFITEAQPTCFTYKSKKLVTGDRNGSDYHITVTVQPVHASMYGIPMSLMLISKEQQTYLTKKMSATYFRDLVDYYNFFFLPVTNPDG